MTLGEEAVTQVAEKAETGKEREREMHEKWLEARVGSEP